MKEKRIGFMNLHCMKTLVVVALCAALVMTGCGSSRPLSDSEGESVSDSSIEASIDGTLESSSEGSSDANVSDSGASLEDTSIDVSGNDESISDSSASGLSEDASDDGIAIDKNVDKNKIVYFDEPVVMYSQRAINVRTGPSTEYDILGYLEYNTKTNVIGQYGGNGWYLIEFFDGEAFVSNRFMAESEIDLDAQRAQEEAAALAAVEAETAARQAAEQAAANNQAQDQTSPQAAAAPAAPAPVAAPAGILFIGDSRCVQMQAAVAGGGCSWVCESAKGYVWLNDTAIGQANNIVGKGTKVVICLGVNDTQNIDKYAELVNAYAAMWAQRGAKTYFCSVNPVWENPYRTEEQVIAFNNAMPGKLVGITWLDTHSWMEANGYRLVDGLHYDANTYINLFNYIVGSI